MIDDIGDADVECLSAIWGRLAAFLEVHAQTEEDLFYPALLHLGKGGGDKSSAAAETKDAIEDHNDIRDAVSAVAECTVGSAAWRKAVAVANKANGDHMAKEEREGLTDFRQQASL